MKLLEHPDSLTDDQLSDWVEALVADLEPESHTLDYKAIVNTQSNNDKKEIAKDVSSFANEIGGVILCGVPEDNTKTDPTPKNPYGIDPIPNLEENLLRIVNDAIVPSPVGTRVRRVATRPDPTKVVYLVWTPNSPLKPHMVQSYGDRRYYRRRQFQSVPMDQTEVATLYQTRANLQSFFDKFIISDSTTNGRRILNYNGAPTRDFMATRLMMVPSVPVEGRINFGSDEMKAWLAGKDNTMGRSWSPAMHGVRVIDGKNEAMHITDIHTNGAMVHWKHAVPANFPNSSVASIAEVKSWREFLFVAGNLYSSTGLWDALTLRLEIHCPEGSALHYARKADGQLLQPSGTDVIVQINISASELGDVGSVSKRLADEMARAFGYDQSDYQPPKK